MSEAVLLICPAAKLDRGSTQLSSTPPETEWPAATGRVTTSSAKKNDSANRSGAKISSATNSS